MMSYYYLSFLIGEIWLDWQDIILLGIILFSVLVKCDLICRIWTFQIIQDRPLSPADKALVLGWDSWILYWAHRFFGLGEWAF